MNTNQNTVQIRFSYNWNNKLACPCFTTFRVNQARLKVGTIVDILLRPPNNKEYQVLKKAQIIEKKVLKLGDVNEWVARIDTGYSLEEFKNIINTMYAKDKEGKSQDVAKIEFCLLLLKTVESV